MVPCVIGKDFETASRILEGHNLRSKKILRLSKERKGYIFNQNPLPGMKVKPRRKIEVFVSLGEAMVVVPNLVGLTLSEARKVLSKTVDPLGEGGLRVGCLAYVHSNKVREGQVLAQSPLAMTSVVRGSSISLLISQGSWPDSFEMPNLVGMGFKDALERIEWYGLSLNGIKEIYNKGKEDLVVDQRPKGGYHVKKGDLVDLVISRWNPLEPDYKEPEIKIIRFRVPIGLLPKEVRIVISDKHGKEEVYNNEEEPGHILEIPVKGEGIKKVLIYVDGELAEERIL